MAKNVYKIPYTIDDIRMRAPVSLQVNGVGPKRQVLIYQVVGWIAGAALIGGFIFLTPLKYSWFWSVVFAISVLLLTGISVSTQRNGLAGLFWIKPTINYFINRSDRIMSRGKYVVKKNSKGHIVFSEDLKAVRTLTDFDAINHESIFSFQNGDYGMLFRVSGYTSLVILDQEMDQLIDIINKWMNSWDPTTSVDILTEQANQRVVNQKRNLIQLNQSWEKLSTNTTAIQQLIHKRLDNMDVVHRRYKSSQQYILIRTSRIDLLDKEVQQLIASMRQGMLKNLEPLTVKETIVVLRQIMYGES